MFKIIGLNVSCILRLSARLHLGELNCSKNIFRSISLLWSQLNFQVKLIDIFTDLSKTYKNIPARMKAEAFKQRVVACFRAWEVSRESHL